MFDNFFKTYSRIYYLSEADPDLQVIETGRIHDWVIENNFAQLHKFVDLLYRNINTMVPLLLSSSFIQIYVMYSMYLTFLR